MRTITINAYTFNELSDEAKDRAIEWYRSKVTEYVWMEEDLDSLKAFCKFYNVNIKDYSVGVWGHSYVETDVSNQHFRGLKLRQVNKDWDETGYCADFTLAETFYSVFASTGNALKAFNEAIDAWLKHTIDDMEYQSSDEYISELLDINEYEFDIYGNPV